MESSPRLTKYILSNKADGADMQNKLPRGSMNRGDYYWGLYRDYYRDPFLHSLLSTRETNLVKFPSDRLRMGYFPSPGDIVAWKIHLILWQNLIGIASIGGSASCNPPPSPQEPEELQ